MAFGLGSQIALPLLNKSGNPLNGFEVAQNVAEVLAYDSSIRYIGMAVYCIDEGAVYRFKSGITNADFVKDSSAKEEYPEWVTGTSYLINDIVTYNNRKYRCILDHTSTTFIDEDACWIECKEVYYVLTKEKYEDMKARGLITDDTADMYIITNADEVEEVSAIYEDYSLFPITLDREVIVYAKNDYEDIATSTIYKNGFYIYKLDTNTWELIGGSGDLETEKEEDPVYVETVTIDDTDEDIEATKTVQVVGMEETTILVANQDSADGTTIKTGDIISITKMINGIEVFSYNILESNEIYNPFD